MATLVGGLLTAVGVVAPAPPAAATFAEGGEGRFIGAIDWFDMGSDGIVIPAEGATRSNTRTIGEHELVTTCTVTPISGNIQTYRSGDYRGDGFDNLYNIGGADDPFDPNDDGAANPNTLVTGIRNSDNNSTVEFDFSCEVTFDGAPLEIGGLVFADAESSNLDQGEYVAATTDQDVSWRVIDRYRNCDTSVLAWLENDRLQLGPDGTQCSEVNNSNGPLAIGFMEGATSATVDLHGGGFSAVSVGVMLQSDFGDAPESYGMAGAIVEPAWEGGEIAPNTLETQVNVSEESFELGQPIAPPIGLGELIDSDATYHASDDATGDDVTSSADEDAIDSPAAFDTSWGETVTQDVVCRSDDANPGYVTGWIDWNANGAFDDGEASDTVACDAGTATLTWTVPDDAVDSLEDSPSFLRLRIAPNETASADPTGIVQGGEVEDHQVIVDVPNPGLTIQKSADPAGPVVPGDSVDYTITVENTGEVDYTSDEPAAFTDDLSDVLDDAIYNDDADADIGTTSYAAPELSWSGPLAVGETATITYSATVNDPLSGDATLANTVVGPPESNCADGSEDPDCSTDVLVRDLVIAKTANPTGEVIPGDTVTYTVTVANPGAGAYTADDPAAFADDLTDVLDDATYNDDGAADIGEVTYTAPDLTWSGPLAGGESATITYSVTVEDPATTEGDGTLDNAVVGPPESNCLDGTEEDCNVPNPVRALHLEKTSDGDGDAVPGETVTYTIAVENTGSVPYTEDAPATFDDDLTEVLDDATFGDASADIGETTYAEPILSWSGPLAPGEIATVTYTVTVNDPPSGDGSMFNVVLGPEESNCTDPASNDPDCVEPDPIRELEITKTSNAADEVLPGDTVTYTVEVTNTGEVPYTSDAPATFADDLTEVLDDAAFDDDATADIGTVSYTEPALSWSGALEPGQTATITYSVTVDDPISGDGALTNAVVGPPESNCDEGTEPECSTVVPVKALEIVKTAEPSGSVAPGETVTYTVEVTNTGQAAYTEDAPATFADDLTEVLDDATFDDDATADIGTTAYAEPTLSWSGALEPGQTATITYSVTVTDPLSGDGTLTNAVVGPPESNCDEGTEPECSTVDPIRELEIAKTSAPEGEVIPGADVTYTIEVTNTGQAPYTEDAPATFADDLTEVLDDAAYNDDATADIGTASYAEPTLSWSGALDPGETATITYSVTIDDPLSGDGTLTNAIVGPPESNCDEGTEPECSTVDPIRALHLEKTSDGDGDAVPGETVTYTIAVENTGAVPYTDEDPATFDDDLTEVLDDATFGEASADIGETAYAEPTLSWSGALAPGEIATVTYTVTVNDPPTGDGDLFNVVIGPEESNCTDPVSTDPDCIEPDPIRGLAIDKTSDAGDEVRPGDTVTYTVEVTNTGQVPYTATSPATFTDDLTEVLDDAAFDDDATADLGEATYDEPTLSWSGALDPGATATITYSVTVNDPLSGNGTLTNAVVGPPESNCDEGTEPECSTVDPIRALEITKTADAESSVLAGDVVEYTIAVTNAGQTPYTDDDPARFTDDLTEVLDDATFDDDATADIGEVTYDEPTLSWSGSLEPDQTATVTYSVTVNSPVTGDGELVNGVVGPDSHCVEGTEEGCSTDVPVRAYEVAKTSTATQESEAGDVVGYTVTVTNTGAADYTDEQPATIIDDLTEVLDDAAFDGDAEASAGEVSYADPTLTWSGPLPVGESVTITYSATIDDPLTGDGVLTNVVTPGEGDGGACLDGDDANCMTTTELAPAPEPTPTPVPTPEPTEPPAPTPSDPDLPATGLPGGTGLTALAALLILLGGSALIAMNRRRQLQ
ncbi:CshA/CshB family fibrillar adhesin-related protein [Microbacterium sp. G2-8]|uniref:CshA/CshB family fibrillar adhesin-related protein n=1 Tax=Microbacterium sp. G2-8 TaxID=2842454 RepID=UPI001C8A171C|nr:CshA/CshB family fibrillar adhesin-related protein [Microbacterium sp. G2-8]